MTNQGSGLCNKNCQTAFSKVNIESLISIQMDIERPLHEQNVNKKWYKLQKGTVYSHHVFD